MKFHVVVTFLIKQLANANLKQAQSFSFNQSVLMLNETTVDRFQGVRCQLVQSICITIVYVFVKYDDGIDEFNYLSI